MVWDIYTYTLIFIFLIMYHIRIQFLINAKIIVKYFYSYGVINLQLSNFVVNNLTLALL